MATITGTVGSDDLTGTTDDDVINGLTGTDSLYGGDGNDTIDGGGDSDTLFGGAGNDVFWTGDTSSLKPNDTVYGGDGNDIIYASGNQDRIFGDNGSDRLIVVYDGAPFNELTFTGGEDGGDTDILDLSELGAVYPDLSLTYEIGGPGTEAGQILVKTSPSGAQLGRIIYSGVEQMIMCFTPGTMIATERGERAIETLRIGDLVLTRDHGLRPVAWIGRKSLSGPELAENSALHPILIRAGALGPQRPERDILVSPSHRMLITGRAAALFFGESEVLAAAKHLTHLDGIAVQPVSSVTYIHVMFAQHEIILANGAWSESFQPGDHSLHGLDDEQREELFDLFPGLAMDQRPSDFPSARRSLRRHEAAILDVLHATPPNPQACRGPTGRDRCQMGTDVFGPEAA